MLRDEALGQFDHLRTNERKDPNGALFWFKTLLIGATVKQSVSFAQKKIRLDNLPDGYYLPFLILFALFSDQWPSSGICRNVVTRTAW